MSLKSAHSEFRIKSMRKISNWYVRLTKNMDLDNHKSCQSANLAQMRICQTHACQNMGLPTRGFAKIRILRADSHFAQASTLNDFGRVIGGIRKE